MAENRDEEQKVILHRWVRDEVERIPSALVAFAYAEIPGQREKRINALAIAEPKKGGVQRLQRTIEGTKIQVLLVDKELFESDVEASAILEFAAGILLHPYIALFGEVYIERWAQIYRQRKIKESLTALALEHPELSSELQIDPKFFVHDSLLRLAHISPGALELLHAIDDTGNELMESYTIALKELESDRIIHIKEGFVEVDKIFVDAVLESKVPVSDQLKQVNRQLQGLIKLGLNGVSSLLQTFSSFLISEGPLSQAFKSKDIAQAEKFLNFPTEMGLTPLSAATNIDELVVKLEPSKNVSQSRLQRFGGVLNEVYMLSYTADWKRKKAIVKRYPNWVSLKWVPIALWTLGTQNFSVMGRARMERECATTSYLGRKEIEVPRILHASFKDRLLLREYVEGKNLTGVIKANLQKDRLSHSDEILLRRVGKTLASVHAAGATLGDCKPENFIINFNGDPVIIDLEQGARRGNEIWDLAEFLYFTGHYADLRYPLESIAEITRIFIEGYLNGGGSRRNITEVSRLRYKKVFIPFTLPQVINTISKTCRRASR